MNLKDMNLLNVLNKQKVNTNKLTLLVLTLLPAVLVTTSFEFTLIYLGLFLGYLLITTLLVKLIDRVSDSQVSWILVLISFVAVSTMMAQVADALFIDFSNKHLLLVYLFPINVLAYMLKEDNKELTIVKSLLDTLVSFVSYTLLMLVFVGIIFLLNTIGLETFSTKPFAAVIILGFVVAAIQGLANWKGATE